MKNSFKFIRCPLPFACLVAGMVLALPSSTRATDVLLNHNDGFNDGQSLKETVLTPANVGSTAFGKLFATNLDRQGAVQPLIKTAVNITTGASPGLHDVAVVATQGDSLYAIDANNGTVLWRVSLLHSFHGGTPTLSGDSSHSITDVPAIDPATNVVYVESYEVENGNDIHVLSAINLADGSAYANPVNIAEGTAASVYVSGPTTLSGKKFDAHDQSSRCLTLNPVNHVVYMSYATPGDVGPYNGWIVGYGATKNSSNNLTLKAVWCATPNGTEGGIWQGGGPLSVDAAGNLYFETGNGTFETSLVTPGYVADGRLTSLTDNANISGGLQVPNKGDYGDSFLKLSPDNDTAQQSDNPNGFGLHVADYFTPRDEQSISNGDVDLGSSSITLLPDSVGSSAHRQLAFGNDKQGIIYLVDRNNMGGYHGDAAGDGASGTNNVVQQLTGATHGAWCAAAFYPSSTAGTGTFYYATNYDGEQTGDVAKAFSIGNGTINATPISTSSSSYGTYTYSGATPEISANGTANGILWTQDRGPNREIAYNAANLGTVLFRSDTVAANGLTGGIEVFNTPTVANAHLYVATSSALNAYGLPAGTYTPVITSATTGTGTTSGLSYQITATNGPTIFTASGLPAGVVINNATGLISGTPSAAGTSTVTVRATNGSGSGTATLTLTVTSSSVDTPTLPGWALVALAAALGVLLLRSGSGRMKRLQAR